MANIFKPRRGKSSVMNGDKSNLVLESGEMFVEFPDTGVGTGLAKVKFGDGTTKYSNLPYAIGEDIAGIEITGSITEDTSTSATDALANVTTGRSLGAIIGSLRRACQLNASAINGLNNDLIASDNTEFKFNKVGDKYGYYNSSGGFIPFKNPTGDKSITSNGTFDITDYARAIIYVPNNIILHFLGETHSYGNGVISLTTSAWYWGVIAFVCIADSTPVGYINDIYPNSWISNAVFVRQDRAIAARTSVMYGGVAAGTTFSCNCGYNREMWLWGVRLE